MTLEWHDLLGTPYDLHGAQGIGLDCGSVTEKVWTRLGMRPASTEDYRVEQTPQGAWPCGEYLCEAQFEKLGSKPRCAVALGDVVLTGADDGSQGVFVLVSNSPRMFLTAQPRRGVVGVPLNELERLSASVLGVYRPSETTDPQSRSESEGEPL